MISAGYDLVVRSRRTVTPEGARPATVCVTGERIVAVGPYELPATATEEIDLGEVALLPGLVDTHVHVNEPGRGEWEGFATATGAAVAGGVTTIIDMPLNSIPPTTDPDALAAKRAAAAGQCRADVGFWGGAVPGNIGRLRALHDAGVYGFKCFLSPSGVPEFPSLPPEETRAAMTEIASFDGLLIVHAEDPGTLTDPAGSDYAAFLASRPSRAEQAAVETLIALAADTGCRVHIVHLSAAECLDPIAAARTDGVRVTAETCPHYLTLCAAEIPAGATQFKCCPPIRDAANRDRLWQGLASGVISGVVSDHSPCPPALKAGGFDAAWGGISSVQLGLPVIWTAARARGHRLADVVRWMAEGPAGFAGLSGKGRIAPGHDADLVAFAAEQRFTVRAEDLRQRHPVSPYAGQELTGAVTATWLRGTLVGEVPHGRLLHRGGIP